MFARPFCAVAKRAHAAAGGSEGSGAAVADWWLHRGADWACSRLSPAPGTTFPDWGPVVKEWQAESLAGFMEWSFIIAVVIIPITRHVLDIVFLHLGQWALTPVMGMRPGPEDLTLVKWREACWKLLTYSGLSLYGAFVVVSEPWLMNTRLLWEDWPAQNHTFALRLWYALEFGLYAYGLVDLLVWEAVRNDYYAMILHHVSTLALVFGSFWFGFLRIGCLVLLINDFVDLWFEGAKIANYAKAERTSTWFYMAFAVTWLLLRQIYCPFWIMWSCCAESWSLVEKFGPNSFNVGTWLAFNVLLNVLQVQHTYWFVFIVAKVQLSVSISVIGRRDTDMSED